MREIYLDTLPRKGKNNSLIDWKMSVGKSVKFTYKDICGEVEIIEYISENKNYYVTIKYKDLKPFKMSVGSFTKCAFGKMLNFYTNNFKYSIGEVVKNEVRDFTIVNSYRKQSSDKKREIKMYEYKCNKCSFCGDISEFNLSKGQMGCSCCRGNIGVVEGYNDLPTTSPWMIKYFQGGYDEAKLYRRNSEKRIFPICPECGNVSSKEISIAVLHKNGGYGCKCKDGQRYPEKFMYNLLKQLNINFVTEYAPNWSLGKRYDFYLEDMSLIIETHGGQHYYGWGNGKDASKHMENDYLKMNLAKENGIEKYVVIDSRFSNVNHMKSEILNSDMKYIFELDNVDFNACAEYASKNIMKEVCEYKRDNYHLSCKQIGEVFDIGRSTVRRYLKDGSEIWDWINYDAEHEKKTNYNNKERFKSTKKSVFVYKDNEFIGEYASAREISSISEKTFGVKLDYRNISAVCLGKQKTHKGFLFSYTKRGDLHERF